MNKDDLIDACWFLLMVFLASLLWTFGTALARWILGGGL